MSLPTAIAWTIAFAILLLAILRWREVPLAIPVAAGCGPALPDGDEEEMPEADRAPRRTPWLVVAVVATAAVRVGLLVALHR